MMNQVEQSIRAIFKRKGWEFSKKIQEGELVLACNLIENGNLYTITFNYKSDRDQLNASASDPALRDDIFFDTPGWKSGSRTDDWTNGRFFFSIQKYSTWLKS